MCNGLCQAKLKKARCLKIKYIKTSNLITVPTHIDVTRQGFKRVYESLKIQLVHSGPRGLTKYRKWINGLRGMLTELLSLIKVIYHTFYLFLATSSCEQDFEQKFACCPEHNAHPYCRSKKLVLVFILA